MVGEWVRFEHRLKEALITLGQDVQWEYLVPGTRYRLDGYIPTHPRTAIELKSSKQNVSTTLRQMREWRNNIVHNMDCIDEMILVIIGDFERNDKLQIKSEADGIGVNVVFVPAHDPAGDDLPELARNTAKSIIDIRAARLKPIPIEISKCKILEFMRTTGHSDDLLDSIKNHGVMEPILVTEEYDGNYTIIDGVGRLLASMELGLTTIPAIRIDRQINPFWKEEEIIGDKPLSFFPAVYDTIAFPPNITPQREITPTPWILKMLGKKSPSIRPSPDIDLISSDTIRSLLTPELNSIMNLINERSIRAVLDHEFIQLCTEYEEEHYTSCGLRVGRLLELLIYGCAQTWDVSLNEPRLNGLKLIDDRSSEIKSAYLDYCDLSGSKKERKFESIQKKILSMNEALFKLQQEVLDIDADELKTLPRNTGAILRDIKRKFSRIEKVRNEFKDGAIENKVHEIMTVRNEAAHADIELSVRELDRSRIDEMIDSIRQLMFTFTTIGHAINEYENNGIDS